MPNNTSTETELLARLGLNRYVIESFAATGANRARVLSAIARLRDEAEEAQALAVEHEEAAVMTDDQGEWTGYRNEQAIVAAKLADMGALLAMVLR